MATAEIVVVIKTNVFFGSFSICCAKIILHNEQTKQLRVARLARVYGAAFIYLRCFSSTCMYFGIYLSISFFL